MRIALYGDSFATGRGAGVAGHARYRTDGSGPRQHPSAAGSRVPGAALTRRRRYTQSRGLGRKEHDGRSRQRRPERPIRQDRHEHF